MKLAVVGVTGLVGQTILKLLEELDVACDQIIPIASERSEGKSISLRNKTYTVCTIEEGLKQNPQVAIFSAGSQVSKQWAQAFTEQGCYVIDNSSAFRMRADVPLVVPEINIAEISKETRLIANPNCSTIQMVVALHKIYTRYGIKRIVISTYQSVSGTGKAAIDQLMNERKGQKELKVYPHPIDLNCLPHGGDFLENGNTTEEEKLMFETQKIWGDDQIGVSATVVRVPVIGGHSESVNIQLKQKATLAQVVQVVQDTPGVTLVDEPERNRYPMPIHAQHKDDVFVGRIRKDTSIENAFNLWIVADNLRKGAATNALQIALHIEKTILT